MGAGPIGIVTALAAIAGRCSQVVITDVQQPKLDLAAALGPIRPVNVAKENLRGVIDQVTEGWGADIVFEASGPLLPFKVCTNRYVQGAVSYLMVYRLKRSHWTWSHSARRRHRLKRCSGTRTFIRALMSSGKIDVKPLISRTFEFQDSVKAFDFALKLPLDCVKAQIQMVSR